jgi:hypothetical protein
VQILLNAASLTILGSSHYMILYMSAPMSSSRYCAAIVGPSPKTMPGAVVLASIGPWVPSGVSVRLRSVTTVIWGRLGSLKKPPVLVSLNFAMPAQIRSRTKMFWRNLSQSDGCIAITSTGRLTAFSTGLCKSDFPS